MVWMPRKSHCVFIICNFLFSFPSNAVIAQIQPSPPPSPLVNIAVLSLPASLAGLFIPSDLRACPNEPDANFHVLMNT